MTAPGKWPGFLHDKEPPFHGKPRRYVLYDRDLVGGKQAETMFFIDHNRTSDGRPKNRSFTNMNQSGMLGTPLSMEVAAISVYPCAGDSAYLAEYDRFVKSHAVFQFVVGQYEKFASVPLALMNVRSVPDRIYRDRVTNDLCNVVVEDGKLVVQRMTPIKDMPLEGMFADSGSPRFISTLTPEGRMRLIDSTEAFRVDISAPSYLADMKEIDVYVCLEGVLRVP